MLDLRQLVGMARQGGDPRQAIIRAAQNDPRMAMAMRMMEGKNAAQLQQMAQNMAKERGLSTPPYCRVWAYLAG